LKKISLWKYGEELAAKLLEEKGYKIIEKNYRFDRAEIDLIAKNDETRTLVFTEVKTRSSKFFGEPEESITFGKTEQIIKAAQGFLMEHEEFEDYEKRFDVIAIFKSGKQEEINHIINAF
jgi:putative endonuclease